MGGRGDKGKGRRRESNQTVSGKPLLFHNGSDPTFNSYSGKKMTGGTPEVCSDKDIPKISQRYPKDISKISQRYPKDIPKISQRYPKDIPKIS